jgi:hypothetical protein
LGTETNVFRMENIHVAHYSLHFLPNMCMLCQIQSPLIGSCPSACSGGGSAARVECTALAHECNLQAWQPPARDKKCPRGKMPTQFHARSVQAVANSSIHKHIYSLWGSGPRRMAHKTIILTIELRELFRDYAPISIFVC